MYVIEMYYIIYFLLNMKCTAVIVALQIMKKNLASGIVWEQQLHGV